MGRLQAHVWIPRPREEIFDLFGTSEGLRSWFASGAEIILAAGLFNFWGDHTPEEPVQFSGHTRLACVDAPGLLSFGWRLRGAESLVDVQLTEQDGGTRVAVTHDSLGPRPSEAGAMHDFWYAALENLRLRALSGRPQQMLDYRAHAGPSFTLGIDVSGSPEQVFEKIADGRQIDRYFGQGARVEDHVGGAATFGWEQGGPTTITAYEPNARLAYRWRYAQEPETEVTWTLAPTETGTRLEVSHSGWPQTFASEAYRAGWFSFLVIVKAMVELGDAWRMVQIEGATHGDV